MNDALKRLLIQSIAKSDRFDTILTDCHMKMTVSEFNKHMSLMEKVAVNPHASNIDRFMAAGQIVGVLTSVIEGLKEEESLTSPRGSTS